MKNNLRKVSSQRWGLRLQKTSLETPSLVNDFQDSKVLTTKSYEVFRRGQNRLYVGPESACDARLLTTQTSRLCCHEWGGWGCPNWLCPRARETLGTSLPGSELTMLLIDLTWPSPTSIVKTDGFSLHGGRCVSGCFVSHKYLINPFFNWPYVYSKPTHGSIFASRGVTAEDRLRRY